MDAVNWLRHPWRARTRWSVLAVLTVGLLGWVAWAERGANPDPNDHAVAAADPAGTPGEVVFASNGRVEGASETVDIGAGIDGVIAELRVHEGDQVNAGDVLAVIDRRELKAELSAARAALEAARQSRTRILRGSRIEDRERADAEVTAAQAVVTQAQAQYRRSAQLFADRVVSKAEQDEAQRNLDVARAQLQAAQKRAELVKAPPLPEEAAKADAEVRLAEQRIRVLEQMLEKSFIRAPTSGTVLRTFLHPGETFSTLVPQPIMRLADTSRLRVRAEVDERDVGRIFIGQRVLVRGEGWDGAPVPGRVSRLGAQMGRKSVRTGDPAEKSDQDVLEVSVELDRQDPRLFVGLRVTTLFLKKASASN
jgi:HlyD family secretion protein